ncbi:MFS transporter [Nonomuraea sp. NPDC059023]|uniref:MFS transporter n=1 Tax=unclassified Nonomuraea TaxID=2593643 RepID=UPI0036CA303F
MRALDDEVTRWSFYSWANHGWVGPVVTVLIGPWLLALAVEAAGSGRATLFSIGAWQVSAEAFPALTMAAASAIQVVSLPLLGAVADTRRLRRRLLGWTCALGSVITLMLATTGGTAWAYAGTLFVIGNLVFGATDVVCNAFLPDLAPPEARDQTSGRGFALGYLGSGLIMAVNLAVLQFDAALGIDRATAVRLCFLAAGLWWAGFGWYAIRGLRDHDRGRTAVRGGLRDSLRTLRRMPHARRYLISYLLITDAISGVTGLASVYLTHELFVGDAGRAAPFLFMLILAIQFVAMGGSVLWTVVAVRLGAKATLLITLLLWCGIVIYAFWALRELWEAIVLGVVIGIVVGGSQSLARSLYSQMIPWGHETTFFSLYAVCDKGTAWIAPLTFSVIVSLTGSYRQAILSLIVIFVGGIVLLVCTDVRHAQSEALR